MCHDNGCQHEEIVVSGDVAFTPGDLGAVVDDACQRPRSFAAATPTTSVLPAFPTLGSDSITSTAGTL